MAVGRNERCPCGSGHKYKNCCAKAERTVFSPAALVLALLLVIGLSVTVTMMINGPDPDSGAERVWSSEHGHWHDAPTGQSATRPDAPVPQPPGPVPPGKVWSPEHGHWHDAP